MSEGRAGAFASDSPNGMRHLHMPSLVAVQVEPITVRFLWPVCVYALQLHAQKPAEKRSGTLTQEKRKESV